MSRAAHKATLAVVKLITHLRIHGGWLTTSLLAAKCQLARETVRRVAEELQAHGWVEGRNIEGTTWWRLGPELPRIGIDYQRRLAAEANDLQQRFTTALSPFPQSTP